MIKNIFNKNTLRVLGIYLVGGYGVIEFVDFIVNHYMLSRNLIDVSIITMLSMLPSVFIIAYFLGKEEEHKWNILEKTGIPLNLIATITFLFILFHDKELGATTTTIIVEDEDGNKIERVIPKSEFRKNAIIFFFDNETGDPDLNWLQFGVSSLIELDLSQDIFLDIALLYDEEFSSDINESGFEKGIGLPLTLKRKIADNHHYQNFISGTILKQGEEFYVKVNLYETKRTKLIAENTFSGKDIFNLVDEISVQIKHDLDIPARHIEEVTDLPVSETTTKSMKALELGIIGANAIIFENEFEKGIGYLEQSVQKDPSFAYIQDFLHHIYLIGNMSEKREQTLELLMKYLYKLPENEQYDVKAMYHAMKGNSEKQLVILKMWADLYPDDINPHDQLADYYWDKNQLDKAVSEYKHILELDPELYNYIRWIGDVYEEKGDFETALKYYEQYAVLFPDEYKSFTIIGDLYQTMGDYPRARSFYEKASAIEPEKIYNMLKLAKIEYRTGNFNKSYEQYEDALILCKTPENKVRVYRKLSSLYKLKGQMSKSLEYLQLRINEAEKFRPPLQVLIDKLFSVNNYIIAGKKDVAIRIIQTVESALQPPYDKVIPLIYFKMYIELGDTVNTEKAEKALDEFEQACNKGEIPIAISGFMLYHGEINEMKGKYEEAILNYKDELKNDPTGVVVNIAIGRCYRKLKQPEKAEKYRNHEPRPNSVLMIVQQI